MWCIYHFSFSDFECYTFGKSAALRLQPQYHKNIAVEIWLKVGGEVQGYYDDEW
jgi:hypothetical protein